MMNKHDPRDYGKVVVLMGGASAEREISLVSGKNILEALLRCGIDAHGLDLQGDVIGKLREMDPDRAFIALHGMGGEDGSIQGVLQYMGIPYTGSDIAGSAITLEKTYTKLIWQSIGIPTPQFRLVSDIEAAIEVMQEYGFPLCVKPTNDGSSVGVTKVTAPEQLPDAFKKASAFNVNVMIEPWIEGSEYIVGILGGSALPVVEIQTPRDFYDFDAKYNENTTNSLCPCNLGPEREQDLQNLALRAFQVTGCSDWGRVDIVEDRLGNFWLLEIDTVPDMTEQSLFPKAAKVLGLSFDEVVIEILNFTLADEAAFQAVA